MSMQEFFSKAGSFDYHVCNNTIVNFYYANGASSFDGARWTFQIFD